MTTCISQYEAAPVTAWPQSSRCGESQRFWPPAHPTLCGHTSVHLPLQQQLPVRAALPLEEYPWFPTVPSCFIYLSMFTTTLTLWLGILKALLMLVYLLSREAFCKLNQLSSCVIPAVNHLSPIFLTELVATELFLLCLEAHSVALFENVIKLRWSHVRLEKLKVIMLVTQSCLTLCDPMDHSHIAPLSVRFSRQEFWSGLPFPSPGDIPDPGIKPESSTSREDSLLSKSPRSAINVMTVSWGRGEGPER